MEIYPVYLLFFTTLIVVTRLYRMSVTENDFHLKYLIFHFLFPLFFDYVSIIHGDDQGDINDLEKVFPTLEDDWGIYIPEVKYLSPEPLVDYTNLALTKYPNIHFVGDALSARGITVSGAQGTYVAESILGELN